MDLCLDWRLRYAVGALRSLLFFYTASSLSINRLLFLLYLEIFLFLFFYQLVFTISLIGFNFRIKLVAELRNVLVRLTFLAFFLMSLLFQMFKVTVKGRFAYLAIFSSGHGNIQLSRIRIWVLKLFG